MNYLCHDFGLVHTLMTTFYEIFTAACQFYLGFFLQRSLTQENLAPTLFNFFRGTTTGTLIHSSKMVWKNYL